MPPRDWFDPFLEQAREDLRAAEVLAKSGVSPSTLCMLIQMVFEKIAKAAYAHAGRSVPRNHKVASFLFQMLRRHPARNGIIQAQPNVRNFVMDLEAAHPTIAGWQGQRPQLEYPWENPSTGTVLWPARDLSLAQRVRNPRDRIAVECLKFASALEKQIGTVIP